MVGQANRFHGRGSIGRLYGKAQSVRSASLLLKYAPNPKRPTYRAAIVVSRKVSKSAVVRNRIRRRLYENVRILSTGFDRSYDLVIVVYDEKIATIAAADLAQEVTKLFIKAKLTTDITPDRAIVEA